MTRPGRDDLAADAAAFTYLGTRLPTALLIAAPIMGTEWFHARLTVPHPGGAGELTRHAEGNGRDAAVMGALRLVYAGVRQHYKDESARAHATARRFGSGFGDVERTLAMFDADDVARSLSRLGTPA